VIYNISVQNKNKTLNPYNQFVKEELPKIRAENPSITSRDAFKEAAERVNNINIINKYIMNIFIKSYLNYIQIIFQLY